MPALANQPLRDDNRARTFPRLARSQLIALALTGGLVLGFGCAPKRSAQTHTPEPDLCDLDGGRWCQACGGPGLPPCPAGASGWLCCSGGVCVAIETTSECAGGVYGWCSNYTEQQQCNASGWCTTVAVCHDG